MVKISITLMIQKECSMQKDLDYEIIFLILSITNSAPIERNNAMTDSASSEQLFICSKSNSFL